MPGLSGLTSPRYLGGGSNIDTFTQGGGSSLGFINALLATALFRCWHLILLFAAWAAAICLISDNVYNLSIEPTLLTVFGTVLGFVISYRTSSSFERYNEGRRYWSSIVYGSRILARTIWFHVPYVDVPTEKLAEMRAQTLLEKKSAVNLIEAFAVAVKHYLRGEETIFYEDLYHLVKFLPVYILPAGRPSLSSRNDPDEGQPHHPPSDVPLRKMDTHASQPPNGIALPALSSTRSRKQNPVPPLLHTTGPTPPPTNSRGTTSLAVDIEKAMGTENDRDKLSAPLPSSHSHPTGFSAGRPSLNRVGTLLPANNPPKYALFDVFPFSLFVHILVKRGKEVKGKRGAKLRARTGNVNQNIPLEITFYLSSYIGELQHRKILDVPTLTTLLNSLHLLVDSLTGLERILTTPIPFSYAIHLRVVTALFIMLLPFQVWTPLRYLTIPATAIATLIFFGFLVAGEEIENPFGYDKNDLNLDHFTQNIIRVELNALTSRPPPELTDWALNPGNTNIFAGHGYAEQGVTPKEWVKRGEYAMRGVLSRMESGGGMAE